MGKRNYDRLNNGGYLPSFREDLKIKPGMDLKERQRRIDARTDMMATILAAYPTTSTKQLAKEYYHTLLRRIDTGVEVHGFKFRFKKSIRPKRKINSILDDDPFDLSGWSEEELY